MGGHVLSLGNQEIELPIFQGLTHVEWVRISCWLFISRRKKKTPCLSGISYFRVTGPLIDIVVTILSSLDAKPLYSK